MHPLVKELFERARELGISQSRITRRTLIAPKTMFNWRKNHYCPRLDTIEDAGEALGGRLVWVWNEEAPAEARGDG